MHTAVIGDIIKSRSGSPGTLDLVERALERANGLVGAVQPLQMTIGDEFQGVYEHVGLALNATLAVALALPHRVRSRFGIGQGEIDQRDTTRLPYAQDGPAWWNARSALDWVERAERSAGMPDSTRTCLWEVDNDGVVTTGDSLWAMTIALRDQVVARMDAKDAALTLGVIEGQTVAEAGEPISITQQAASRRLKANGGYALIRSWNALMAAGDW